LRLAGGDWSGKQDFTDLTARSDTAGGAHGRFSIQPSNREESQNNVDEIDLKKENDMYYAAGWECFEDSDSCDQYIEEFHALHGVWLERQVVEV